MSKLSIYENAWLNLVFEGKNKEYGAYQLRKESPRTTLYAFALGLLFIGSVGGVGLLLSSFGTKPPINNTPVFDDSLKITDVHFIEPPRAVEPPIKHETLPAKDETDAKELTPNVEIVSTDNADNVRNNDDPPAAPEGPKGSDGSGTTITTASGTGLVPDAPTAAADTNTPIIVAALDKLPEFPGGIKKFYDYVGSEFEKPEIDQTVNVLMSFVIEKDGSMTDIKVLRNPGYGLDKEAIRVLKSLRTKWSPGFKNGNAVRVLYTLPIKVTRN